MNRNLISLIAGCCLLAACGSVEPEPTGPTDDASSEQLSKPEARNRAAKADNGIDYCAELGWYGDGICDDFCAMPDPDCADTPACNTDSDCAAGEYCQPGFCYFYCSVDDEDCCTDNHCLPLPDDDPQDPDEPEDVYPPGDECDVDADCGEGEMCEQAFCPAFCAEVDGEDCCPDACVPVDPQPEDDECDVDADCGDGEVCQETICGAVCAEGATCCPQVCVPSPDPVEDECDTDADCESGEFCQPGLCLLYCSVDDPGCCGPNECVAN